MNPNKIEYIRGDKSLLEKFGKTAGLLQKLISCRKDLTPLQYPDRASLKGTFLLRSTCLVKVYRPELLRSTNSPFEGGARGMYKSMP
jgi:hypothetical protein